MTNPCFRKRNQHEQSDKSLLGKFCGLRSRSALRNIACIALLENCMAKLQRTEYDLVNAVLLDCALLSLTWALCGAFM